MLEFVETAHRHFGKLFLLFILLFGAFAYLFLSKDEGYTARTLILYKVGREYGFVIDETNTGLKSPNPGDFQNAVNAEMLMLDDPIVREEALELVGLERVYPALAEDPELEDYAYEIGAQRLRNALSISLVTGSYVVMVAVTHGDPEIAAELANAVVERYLRKRQTVLFAAETSALRQRIEVAQLDSDKTRAQLEELLGGKDPAVYEAEFAAMIADNTSLREQISAIDALLMGLEQRDLALTAELNSLQPVLIEHKDYVSNPVIEAIEASSAGLEAERDVKAQMLGANHPTVRALSDELVALQRRLSGQTEEVIALRRESVNPIWREIKAESLATKVRINEERAKRAYFEDRIAANTAAIEERASVINHMRVLQEHLTLQNERIATFSVRMRDSEGLEGAGGAAQTSARVIEAAQPPLGASGAPLSLRLAIAAVVAGAISAVAMVSLYMLTKSPGSGATVRDRLNLPVLGEVRHRTRRELAAAV